jgi:hypothetical protein
MTNYRTLLLCFLAVSWIFLTGLNEPVDIDMSTEETQKTEVELKSIETENSTQKLLETKQVKVKGSINSVKANPLKTTIKTTDSDFADKNNLLKRNDLEKPLDLSVPFEDAENADVKIEQKSPAESQVTNIFTPETKKKPRPLELDSGFLMSPEPEAEKLKSVDGAGIVIKLKP